MGLLSNIMDNSIEKKMMKSLENLIDSVVEGKMTVLAMLLNSAQTEEQANGSFLAWRSRCIDEIREHVYSIFAGADPISNQCFIMTMENPSVLFEDFDMEKDTLTVGMLYAISCFSMTRNIPIPQKCIKLNHYFAFKIDNEMSKL